MMNKSARLDYLDLMKGFGIFFVVWAHTMCPVKDWIYSFHMPLFFVISGLFFSNKTDFKSFVLKKAKQLLIPFVTFNLIGVLAHIMVYVLTKKNPLLNFSFRDEIGFGYFKGDLYFPNLVTWFLWSLFFISVLVYLLSRWTAIRRWMFVVLSAGLYCLSLYVVSKGEVFPYFLNSILCGQFYFVIGYVGKEWILKAVQFKGYVWIVLVALIYTVSYIYYPTTADIMRGIVSGNALVHFLQCMAILYLIAVICVHIKRLPFFTFWGINSLYMLGLNFPMLCVIDYCYFSFVQRNDWTAFLGVWLTFLLAYPIYFLLDRYLPFSLGKDKK